ncbi:hypothetical protein LTR84_001056 [Exophiala bonariae]|uniref:tRNA (uracil-O(2)-)-methyltransferase n=1 Tax=Exophiala bonariae TaxID=1690606 RepID=A0AAV9NSB6_9EURO|nr:hypothetical protein LTR84_001056 [Exophiala bonariae]
MLTSGDVVWRTDSNYRQGSPNLSGTIFAQVNDLLLESPNLNSTHLFRADILFDSSGHLKTALEKEKAFVVRTNGTTHGTVGDVEETTNPLPQHAAAPVIDGAILKRSVLRRLIPRNAQLDPPLEQWCYLYDLSPASTITGHIVVYVPQVESENAMPWYHPTIKAMAYLYETTEAGPSLSIHFLSFTPDAEVPLRLHRTFISLLQTFLRLAKGPTPDTKPINGQVEDGQGFSLAPSAIKDTILPQHTVQDTYSRLKQKYAPDLISRWVEQTEPSKHVFEDVSIAAFLIELWRQMYETPSDFPGFIDVACGNGVLSYILIQEGYPGRGFDARRRKTWEVLGMDDHLDEMICVPQPFISALKSDIADFLPQARVHNGLFQPNTFIISNHADELTPWTPLLATLSSPNSPLPFLAIPCCSHALSGAKHRYQPKDSHPKTDSKINGAEEQPATGDLKALRAAKLKAANHSDDKSMYACLTRKVVSITEEIGMQAEVTLMRIPSTRNIGIVGNRRSVATRGRKESQSKSENPTDPATVAEKVVARECTMSGGISAAAQTWIERAQKLQTGAGRGKVNLGGKTVHD